MNAAAKLMVVVGSDIKGALGGLGDVGKAVGRTATSFGRATGGAFNFLGGLGLAAGGVQTLIGSAVGLSDVMGVGLAREMEEVSAVFRTLLGSEDAATALLGELRREADQTPYAFTEIATAAAGLLPVAKRTGDSILDLVRTAEILGAVNASQGLEGAVVAMRELAGGDIQSLRERFEVVDSKAVKDLIGKGVPAFRALNEVMERSGIGMGLVEARAKTTGGRLSTFADLIGGVQLSAGEPILGAFGVELDRTSGLVSANIVQLKEWARAFGTGVAGGIRTVGESLGSIFVEAQAIAGAHGLGGIQSAAIAIENALGRAFGPGVAGGFHMLLELVGNFPAVFAAFQQGIRDVREDYMRFVIDLSKTPVFGDSFRDSAARFREELGFNTPGSAAFEMQKVGVGPSLGTFNAEAARGLLASAATGSTSTVTIGTINVRSQSDLDYIAALVGAQEEVSAAAAPDAPGQ